MMQTNTTPRDLLSRAAVSLRRWFKRFLAVGPCTLFPRRQHAVQSIHGTTYFHRSFRRDHGPQWLSTRQWEPISPAFMLKSVRRTRYLSTLALTLVTSHSSWVSACNGSRRKVIAIEPIPRWQRLLSINVRIHWSMGCPNFTTAVGCQRSLGSLNLQCQLASPPSLASLLPRGRWRAFDQLSALSLWNDCFGGVSCDLRKSISEGFETPYFSATDTFRNSPAINRTRIVCESDGKRRVIYSGRSLDVFAA